MSYEKEQEPGAIGWTYPSSSDRAVDQGIPERGKQQNLRVWSFSCRGEVNRGFWVSESSSAPFKSKVSGMQPVRWPGGWKKLSWSSVKGLCRPFNRIFCRILFWLLTKLFILNRNNSLKRKDTKTDACLSLWKRAYGAEIPFFGTEMLMNEGRRRP